MSDRKNAIIIGASSGIGEALAVRLSIDGYHLGLVARRENELKRVKESLDSTSTTAIIDVADTAGAISKLSKLIDQLGDVELFIICAGVGFENPTLEWQPEFDTIAVNVLGFAAMAGVSCEHLQKRGSGQLVGISSIAALRGQGSAPAYGASKAFMSNYLQALRHRFAKLKMPVQVLDVQPGFVDTAMAKGDNLFWVAPPEKAAKQIMNAINNRKSHVYITKRWRLFAWILKLIPNWLYHKV